MLACAGLGAPLLASEANQREIRVLSGDRSLPEGLALRLPGRSELASLTFRNGKRSTPYPLPAGVASIEVVKPLADGAAKPAEVEILQTVELEGLGNRILLLFVNSGTGWKITALSDDTQAQPVGALVILNGTEEPLLATVGETQFEVPAGRMGAPTDIRQFAETRRMVTTEIMDNDGNSTTETYEAVENGVMITLRKRTGPHGGHLYESPITASTTSRALLIVLPPLEVASKRYRILLVPEHIPPPKQQPVSFLKNSSCKKVCLS